MRRSSWAGLAAFTVGWLVLRNSERMFGLMLVAFGWVFFVFV